MVELEAEQQLRERIFELKAGGRSLRGIAGELGVSMGKVQRELRKRADQVHGNGQLPAPGEYVRAGQVIGYVDPGLAADPDIRERQKRLALRRLELQESRLGIDEIEQQRRLQLLEGKGGGSGDAMAAYLMGEVQRVRSELERRQTGGPSSLIEQLKELRDLGNTVALFAPPAGPTTPADVEFKLGLRRLELEEQRILQEREKELALRQREVDSANMRNDALANFVQGFGPVLQQIAQKWLADRDKQPQQPAAPQLAAGSDGQQPAQPGEVAGSCPACGIGIAMIEGEQEKCPGCGTQLACAGGQITAVAAGPGDPRAVRPTPTVTF